MSDDSGIALHRLVLSLSEALDWVRPDGPGCRLRVTYIAVRLAQRMGLDSDDLQDLFLVAALQRSVLEALSRSDAGDGAGDPLRSVTWIARSCRTRWDHGQGAELDGCPVPLAAHILWVAEGVGRAVDRSFPVLAQAESIIKQIHAQSGSLYRDECVAAFERLAATESIWLDCVSARLHSLIAARLEWPALPVDHPAIRHVAKVFGRIVDSLSPWTAGHSAGVAATAVGLAEILGFNAADRSSMRIAGWLHDLGKLSVPAHVLDKEDRLSRQEWAVVKGHPYYTHQILHSTGAATEITEWASFHHERPDGKGYPFGLAGSRLSMGARIMAVADAYTAIMQDRPYRPGAAEGKAGALLECMAANGTLDGEVVGALIRCRGRIEDHRLLAQRGAMVEPLSSESRKRVG